MQPAGDRVGLLIELAAGVQLGHHHLDRGHLLLGVLFDGDPAPVVGDLDPAVGQDGDGDRLAVAGQVLVHGVVDHLPHEVVQPPFIGGSDVHAGALADGLEAFEDADRLRGVLSHGYRHDAKAV